MFKIDDPDMAGVVDVALRAGYRHFDLAAYYGNERAFGHALRESGAARDELFLTSKVWNTDHGHTEALAAFERTRAHLGVDVLDLYLIHWPVPSAGRYLETWQALEGLQQQGLTRAIGVSNFTRTHLERLLAQSDVKPAVNQVELHPYFQQRCLRTFHHEHGIVTQAWSPLGRGAVLDDPVVVEIAARHHVSPAQAILRWHLQLGTVVFPKSSSPARIAANIDLFGFELDEDDMQRMRSLDRGRRTGPDPDSM
ncbi:aldo/keto reductase [Intrasporangium sp.]|uniref:aldo/keto reductase n=1 Tax=Intrasporangium sp. TaxID=1925024 RepID=UPI002D793D82|nr:aldo/keto reductase [Intrasporangium sp.]